MGLKELMERYVYCKPDMEGWYSLAANKRITSTNGQETTAEAITHCEKEIAGIDDHVCKWRIDRVDIITKQYE